MEWFTFDCSLFNFIVHILEPKSMGKGAHFPPIFLCISLRDHIIVKPGILEFSCGKMTFLMSDITNDPSASAFSFLR